MKWFDRWFAKKCQQAWDDAREQPDTAINTISAKQARVSRVRESDEIASEPIAFKMFKASGGWVIEFRHYDRKYDKVDSSLYVVNDEQQLGDSISKIITMEALKR